MRPEDKSSSSDLHCILCIRPDETEITGALSSVTGIAAHQNCLLYASGIYCKNSPTYDDMFGFDVKDVIKESKRGRKLRCSQCKQYGATAGCEVKSCKRTYHFPCSSEAHAIINDDENEGIYRLYCAEHNPHANNYKRDAGVTPSGSDLKRSDRNDQNSSHGTFESDSDSVPRSQNKKRKFEESCFGLDKTQMLDSVCAPIESESEDAPSRHNTQSLESDGRSRDNEEPRREVSPTPTGSGDEEDDENELSRDMSDESQSLLPKYLENVPFTVIADSGPSIGSVAENSRDPFSPAPSPGEAALSNLHQPASDPEQAAALHSNPPVSAHPFLDSPPLGNSSNAEKASDLTAPAGCSNVQDGKSVGNTGVSDSGATLFWSRCNKVGCTEAIFKELAWQISSLAEKVQNQHATQEDCAVSLRMLEASGRLPEIFKQMEKDLENQERQLQQKRAALCDAMAVLKRITPSDDNN